MCTVSLKDHTEDTFPPIGSSTFWSCLCTMMTPAIITVINLVFTVADVFEAFRAFQDSTSKPCQKSAVRMQLHDGGDD